MEDPTPFEFLPVALMSPYAPAYVAPPEDPITRLAAGITASVGVGVIALIGIILCVRYPRRRGGAAPSTLPIASVSSV